MDSHSHDARNQPNDIHSAANHRQHDVTKNQSPSTWRHQQLTSGENSLQKALVSASLGRSSATTTHVRTEERLHDLSIRMLDAPSSRTHSSITPYEQKVSRTGIRRSDWWKFKISLQFFGWNIFGTEKRTILLHPTCLTLFDCNSWKLFCSKLRTNPFHARQCWAKVTGSAPLHSVESESSGDPNKRWKSFTT